MKQWSIMTVIGLALGAMIATGEARPARAERGAAGAPIVVAQACGWYVIAGCYRNWNQAENRAQQIGAFVADTSSGDYPNFRPGWFCAAFGPYDKYTAQSKSRYIKPSYIKNAC